MSPISRSPITVLTAVILLAVVNAPAAHGQDSIPLSKVKDLNCSLSMSNDYVDNTFMMHDVAPDEKSCLAACRKFADESLTSMTQDAQKLEWSCSYDGRAFFTQDMLKKDHPAPTYPTPEE